MAAPAVTSFLPITGRVGDQVVITGTGFDTATGVTIDGIDFVTFVAGSATEITGTIPVGATTGKIAVINPDGTGTSSADFTMLAPAVSSFLPIVGQEGDQIVIAGLGLTAASAVTIGGVAVTDFTVNSAIKITATIPADVVTGKVAVTTDYGTGTSSADFTVGDSLASPDVNLTLSVAQRIEYSEASSNCYHFPNGVDAEIRPLEIEIYIAEPFTAAGAGTLTISIQDSADGETWADIVTSKAIPKASLKLQNGPAIVLAIPTGNLGAREYVRTFYTVATGPFTAGKITAAFKR